MKRQMLLLAALLMAGLGAWAQKAEQKFNLKKFQVYAVGFYNPQIRNYAPNMIQKRK